MKKTKAEYTSPVIVLNLIATGDIIAASVFGMSEEGFGNTMGYSELLG